VSLAEVRVQLDRWLNRQWQKRGLWLGLMAPFSLLFALVVWVRRKQHSMSPATLRQDTSRVAVPILIVGNIYIGGTGKTPVVIALIQQLKALGWQPGVISRGYGTAIGAHAVTRRGRPSAREVGDEPALIARATGVPISVHPDRSLACRTLVEQYPDVDLVIADDGLQHLRLPRDIEIVVQDERGCGNGWVLPAGPLREPISRLSTVNALITRKMHNPRAALKPEGATRQSALLAGGLSQAKIPRHVSISLKISQFHRLVDHEILGIQMFLDFANQSRVAAVAGIATPLRFFDSLRSIGLNLDQTHPLSDHDSFDSAPFSSIDADIILITGKDAVKCEAIADPRVWVTDIEMTFSDPDFVPWLDHQLKTVRARLRRD